MMHLFTTLALGVTLLTMTGFSSAEPDIIAHRGGAHAAPENTLAAFRQGFADGADGVEGDFYLSKDRRVVCFHDENTRTLADRNVWVTHTTLPELKTLDVGGHKGAKWRGEQIPTLEEVIEVIPPGKSLFIEVKDSKRLIPAVNGVLAETGFPLGQVTLISFDAAVIKASKDHMPGVKALWIVNEKTFRRDGPQDIIEHAKEMNADGIDTKAHDGISNDFARDVAQAGLELHCWTINDVKTAKRFAELGVQSITTDRPALLTSVEL